MLRNLGLRSVYRTDEDNLLEDFYIPALKASVQYDRAVGFFSTGMLSVAAQGLSTLIENDGHMRLIIGGDLEKSDFQAIENGYELKRISDSIGQKIIHAIENVEDALLQRRVEALAWLVAAGKLEIKVALKQHGMYHEKIGILTDQAGDKLVFSGSANETASALLPDFNFESINVFEYWRPEFRSHCDPYIIGFEKLWENRAKRTRVIDFPEASRQKLITIANRVVQERGKPPSTAAEIEAWQEGKRHEQDFGDSGTGLNIPRIPEFMSGLPFSIFPHQQAALNAWKANQLNGILALATGAGKTLTAIYGAVRIFEATKRLFVIICVPYQSLADQWLEILMNFNINALACFASRDNWHEKLSESVTLFQTGAVQFACAVVVNRTLQSAEFQTILQQVPGEALLWIGDECHHHSSEGLNKALPLHARSRLGLSATPEHYLDASANDRLTSFYGQVTFTYGLDDALRDKILTPYNYHVVLVDLRDDEIAEYEEISAKISQLSALQGTVDLERSTGGQLEMLLFRRARLLGSAANKLTKLKGILATRSVDPLTLFYCGDGSVDDEESERPLRQVDAVSRLLHSYGWKNAHFTSRESRSERRAILDHFRLAEIDALVAIRCLDEGIDVPACRTAFILASSRNPKQFIQRRGRILRKSPNKESAEIFDFVVRIPEGSVESSQLERKLFVAELRRVAEFARLASNAGEVVQELAPILTKYDLQHHLV